MFVLKTDITIGKYKFRRCMNAETERSIHEVADICRIKVPISVVLIDGDSSVTSDITKVLKVGDEVKAKFYYEDYEEHAEEFEGFVKQINYGYPAEIVCENKFWKLRQKSVHKTFLKTNLQTVLKYILEGTGIGISGNVPSLQLDSYVISPCDAAFALQKIKDDFGLTAFFTPDGKLYVGLAYTENYGTVKYILSGEKCNVIDANDLKMVLASDRKLEIKAININGDNSRIEANVGTSGGDSHTMYFYNVKKKKDLEALAQAELKKYNYDGYEGTLKTFLIPKALPGMTAQISDPVFGREGRYFIESVKTSWGMDGGRRDVQIGIKVN